MIIFYSYILASVWLLRKCLHNAIFMSLFLLWNVPNITICKKLHSFSQVFVLHSPCKKPLIPCLCFVICRASWWRNRHPCLLKSGLAIYDMLSPMGLSRCSVNHVWNLKHFIVCPQLSYSFSSSTRPHHKVTNPAQVPEGVGMQSGHSQSTAQDHVMSKV